MPKAGGTGTRSSVQDGPVKPSECHLLISFVLLLESLADHSPLVGLEIRLCK